MSTDRKPHRDNPGGKTEARDLVAQGKATFETAKDRETQLNLLDPLTADEIHDAKERLGHGAGMVAIMRNAREHRGKDGAKGGRPKGVRNKRTEDFARYLRQFGTDPAVTLMRIQSMTPEELIARSQLVDPEKRRLSYGDALAHIERSAEALMPYLHGKKPVQVELDAKGDFNLIIPGLNMSQADATAAAAGQFVLDADYSEVDEENGQ